MAQSIASLRNLQALSLSLLTREIDAFTPLEGIKNLKHLRVALNCGSNEIHFVRSILLNSTSTLQSLVVAWAAHTPSFLQNWERMVSTDDALAKEKHSLTVLKSFTLCGVSFDANFISSLQRAIDFMGLRELTLEYLAEGKEAIFEHLTNLAILSQSGARSINLRSLCLEMSNERYGMHRYAQTYLDHKYRFISSFNTLTSLELKDHNQYPDTIATNPGLPNALLQAIIKHKGLKRLKISYYTLLPQRKIPCLSATTIAAIIGNLPRLQEFEFEPEEAEIVRNSLNSLTRITHDTNICLRMKPAEHSRMATIWSLSPVLPATAGWSILDRMNLISIS